MQMKHHRLIKVVFVLLLIVGGIDIYAIYAFVIPNLFLDESEAPSVPVQMERPPHIVSRDEVRQPVPVAVPAEDPLVDKTADIKATENQADAPSPVPTVSPSAESMIPTKVNTLDPPGALDKTAESVVSDSDVEKQGPESQLTRKALPKATVKQLSGIEPLRFGPNRTLLWKFEKKMLKEAAKQVSRYSNVAVHVVGHADNQEKNPDELSMARALKVKAFLEAEGVPTELIEVESVGAKKPATKKTSAEDRKKNRRVRVRLFIKDTM